MCSSPHVVQRATSALGSRHFPVV